MFFLSLQRGEATAFSESLTRQANANGSLYDACRYVRMTQLGI